jgi:hypothetical protein
MVEKLTQDERANLTRAMGQLKDTFHQLKFARDRVLRSEARSGIVGETTYCAIEALNKLRNTFGFDDIEMVGDEDDVDSR